MTYGEAFLDFLKKIEIEDRDDFFNLFDYADHNGLLYDELSGKQTNFVDPEDYNGREEIDENDPNFNPDIGQYAVHCNGFEGLQCKNTLCINCEYRNFWRREYKEKGGRKMKYIHLGKRNDDTKFDITKFQPIKNINGFSKPDGGYWASSVDTRTQHGWMNFCEENGEYNWLSYTAFIFELTPSAKILRIESKADIPFDYVDHRFVDEKRISLVKQSSGFLIPTIYLDFETLAKDYDAIEILAGSNVDLYHAFYGWDCDSILIMNPSIIKEVDECVYRS